MNKNPNNHKAAVTRNDERLQNAEAFAQEQLEQGWDKKTVKTLLVSQKGLSIREARAILKKLKTVAWTGEGLPPCSPEYVVLEKDGDGDEDNG